MSEYFLSAFLQDEVNGTISTNNFAIILKYSIYVNTWRFILKIIQHSMLAYLYENMIYIYILSLQII